jgi:hypothetical protein
MFFPIWPKARLDCRPLQPPRALFFIRRRRRKDASDIPSGPSRRRPGVARTGVARDRRSSAPRSLALTAPGDCWKHRSSPDCRLTNQNRARKISVRRIDVRRRLGFAKQSGGSVSSISPGADIFATVRIRRAVMAGENVRKTVMRSLLETVRRTRRGSRLTSFFAAARAAGLAGARAPHLNDRSRCCCSGPRGATPNQS